MNRMLMLLQLALAGCRDACYHKALGRAFAELRLASSILWAIRGIPERQIDAVAFSVAEYGKHEEQVTKHRFEAYRSLLGGINDQDVELAFIETSQRFQTVCAALDIGTHRVQKALLSEDFTCGEIEADHIHNLPHLLEVLPKHSLNNYLNRERSFYLARLDEQCGKEKMEDAQNQFAELWKILSNECL